MRRTIAAALIAALAAGCAPSVEHLRRNLLDGSYDAALERVEGDERMENELAALVLERALIEGEESSATVAALASTGAGRHALERLVDRGESPLAELAGIALHRRCAPRDSTLEAYLGSDYSDVRAAAARAWGDELEVERLKELILDDDPRVRRAAVRSLDAAEGGERAARQLCEVLRLDPDPKVRAAAARAGEALGDGALDALRSALEDGNMGVRHAALRGLGELGGEAAVGRIRELAVGPISETTVVAAAELTRLGEKPGRERLEGALEHERSTVRATAVTHAGRALEPDQRRELLERALGDEAPRVVVLAASLLLGDAEPGGEVAAALERVIEAHSVCADEARDMLAVIGDPEAIEQVAAVFEDGDAEELVAVLGRVRRARELRPDFVRLLADERGTVRLAAARAVLATS
ncbi:MAG: HEAT repeat domain-containing protein [Polyangia bacterium]